MQKTFLHRLVVTVVLAVACSPALPQDNTPAVGDKAIAQAAVAAARRQAEADRATLKTERNALDEARQKARPKGEIDSANARVRATQSQLARSQGALRQREEALARIEKPERDAAKARGDALRTERARQRATQATARNERRAAGKRAEGEESAARAERKDKRDKAHAERDAPRAAAAADAKAERESQRAQNEIESEKNRAIRVQREAELKAAREKRAIDKAQKKSAPRIPLLPI